VREASSSNAVIHIVLILYRYPHVIVDDKDRLFILLCCIGPIGLWSNYYSMAYTSRDSVSSVSSSGGVRTEHERRF